MKKLFSVVVVLAVLAALLCGCGKSEEPAKEESAPVGLANPMKIVTSEEQAAAGLTLNAPEGAENVVYKLINEMIETDFTLGGVEYCYRAQPTGELECFDMSGLHYTWTSEENGEVAGRAAVAKTCRDAGFVMWLDVVPGINYTLGTSSPVSAETLFEVAGSAFVPAQGDVG